MIRLMVAGLVIGAVLGACSGSGATTATGELVVLAGSVEISVAERPFASAQGGETVRAGDAIRTGSDGRAEIRWFDGSITRLDFGTTFAVTTLESIDQATVIAGEQSGGNTYHVVVELGGIDGRFDVATPTAVAGVEGTEYAVFVEVDGSTTVAAIDDAVIVAALGGEIAVDPGLALVIPASATTFGELGTPEPIAGDLLASEWLRFNNPPPTSFEVAPIQDAVTLDSFPVGTEATIEIFAAPGGELLDSAAVTIESPDGLFYASPVDIEAGAYIVVTTDSEIRDTVVAPLTYERFDRATGMLEGTAPSGAEVVAFIELIPDKVAVYYATADGSGAWSILITEEIGLDPELESWVKVFDDDGDTTLVRYPADV